MYLGETIAVEIQVYFFYVTFNLQQLLILYLQVCFTIDMHIKITNNFIIQVWFNKIFRLFLIPVDDVKLVL